MLAVHAGELKRVNLMVVFVGRDSDERWGGGIVVVVAIMTGRRQDRI